MKEKKRLSGLTPDLLPQKLRWGSKEFWKKGERNPRNSLKNLPSVRIQERLVYYIPRAKIKVLVLT